MMRVSIVLPLLYLLHWFWETLHGVAYVETSRPLLQRAIHCLPMAGIDALWSLGLMGIVWGARSIRPAIARGWRAPLILSLLGGASAALLEMDALATGRWSYNGSMPLIPVLRVGLWPVLQMMSLPVAALWVAGRSARR